MQTDSRIFIYILAGIFHMFKTEVKTQNKAKIFPNSGCVLHVYAEILIFWQFEGKSRGAYYTRKITVRQNGNALTPT